MSMSTAGVRREVSLRLVGVVVGMGLLLLPGPVGCVAPGGPSRSRSGNALERFEFRKLLMGVGARIVLFGEDEEQAVGAASAAFARIAELEEVLSDYRSDSEVMLLREAMTRAGEGGTGERVEIPISEDLASALRLSMDLRVRTNGAFDERLGELTRLWRDARARAEPPDRQAWERAFDRAGRGYEIVDRGAAGSAISPDGAISFDFGGIGKGLACDEAAAVLRAHGIERFLVDMGGDLVLGKAPSGSEGWRIAIEGEGSGPGYVVLEMRAIATSGASEQFLEVEGVRFSHILDPRRGEPLRETRSVSVMARDGATADALASALSVLGAAGMREIEDRFVGVEWRVEESAGGEEERSAGFPELIAPAGAPTS